MYAMSSIYINIPGNSLLTVTGVADGRKQLFSPVAGPNKKQMEDETAKIKT